MPLQQFQNHLIIIKTLLTTQIKLLSRLCTNQKKVDDFELSNIIDTLDKETRQQKQLVPGDDNITAIPPPKPVENAITSNYIQNVTMNKM